MATLAVDVAGRAGGAGDRAVASGAALVADRTGRAGQLAVTALAAGVANTPRLALEATVTVRAVEVADLALGAGLRAGPCRRSDRLAVGQRRPRHHHDRYPLDQRHRLHRDGWRAERHRRWRRCDARRPQDPGEAEQREEAGHAAREPHPVSAVDITASVVVVVAVAVVIARVVVVTAGHCARRDRLRRSNRRRRHRRHRPAPSRASRKAIQRLQRLREVIHAWGLGSNQAGRRHWRCRAVSAVSAAAAASAWQAVDGDPPGPKAIGTIGTIGTTGGGTCTSIQPPGATSNATNSAGTHRMPVRAATGSIGGRLYRVRSATGKHAAIAEPSFVYGGAVCPGLQRRRDLAAEPARRHLAEDGRRRDVAARVDAHLRGDGRRQVVAVVVVDDDLRCITGDLVDRLRRHDGCVACRAAGLAVDFPARPVQWWCQSTVPVLVSSRPEQASSASAASPRGPDRAARPAPAVA